jgi:hypothetical protein
MSSYRSKELIIRKPSLWKRYFELQADGEKIGSLTYPRLFSSLAVIEMFGEEWEAYRPSIWRSTFEIRPKGNQMPIARYVRDGWKLGGIFELPQGARLKFEKKIWKKINEITTLSGKKLIRFNNKGITGSAAHVEILESSDAIDKNPWVIFVVWNIIQEQREHAAAAVST